MARKDLRNYILTTLLLQAHLTVAQSLNTSSSLENYISQNQRQYEANILEYERQIADVRKNYLDQLSTTDVWSAQVEEQLRLIDDKLNPLELLNERDKWCVQKYRGGLITWASVKASINSCISSASSYVNSLVSSLESTKLSLNNYYNNNVKTSLANCKKNNPSSEANYTICVTSVSNVANIDTLNSRNTFKAQLNDAKCAGDNRVQTAIRCTFGVIFNAVSAIGRVTSSIDECIAGVGECEACLHVYDSLNFKNETMPNPLYGYEGASNITCLYVQFSDIAP